MDKSAAGVQYRIIADVLYVPLRGRYGTGAHGFGGEDDGTA
jgi:hypothetical protein